MPRPPHAFRSQRLARRRWLADLRWPAGSPGRAPHRPPRPPTSARRTRNARRLAASRQSAERFARSRARTRPSRALSRQRLLGQRALAGRGPVRARVRPVRPRPRSGRRGKDSRVAAEGVSAQSVRRSRPRPRPTALHEPRPPPHTRCACRVERRQSTAVAGRPGPRARHHAVPQLPRGDRITIELSARRLTPASASRTRTACSSISRTRRPPARLAARIRAIKSPLVKGVRVGVAQPRRHACRARAGGRAAVQLVPDVRPVPARRRSRSGHAPPRLRSPHAAARRHRPPPPAASPRAADPACTGPRPRQSKRRTSTSAAKAAPPLTRAAGQHAEGRLLARPAARPARRPRRDRSGPRRARPGRAVQRRHRSRTRARRRPAPGEAAVSSSRASRSC